MLDRAESRSRTAVKIRFQADADFNEDIVMGLRRRGPELDFQTATEAGA
jgi:hypothetical protein